jgi:hypothetical protein
MRRLRKRKTYSTVLSLGSECATTFIHFVTYYILFQGDETTSEPNHTHTSTSSFALLTRRSHTLFLLNTAHGRYYLQNSVRITLFRYIIHTISFWWIFSCASNSFWWISSFASASAWSLDSLACALKDHSSFVLRAPFR